MVRKRKGPLKLTFFVKFFWVMMACASSAWAAIHQPSKPYQTGIRFYEHSSELVTKQPETKVEDVVYRSYFEGVDGRITTLYQDQFSQHEQNLQFRSSSWRGEFISNSISSGGVQYDWQVREQFARQVFRMRVDQGIRETLKTLRQSPAIAKAQGAIESLQNMSVPVSSSNGRPAGQLRMGYDLYSDSSKVEYVGGTVDLGVYKNGLLSSPGNMQATLMNVSSDLGASVGRGSLSMPLSGDNIQASISRQISKSVSTSISSTQPLKARQDSSYYWQMAFSF